MFWLIARTCEAILWLALALGTMYALCAITPAGGFGFGGALAVRPGEVVQFQLKVGKVILSPYDMPNEEEKPTG